MDLYVQIGVLFLFTAAFAMVSALSADVMELSLTTAEVMEQPTEQYNQDSSLTSEIMYVDIRIFEQWIFNASDQRDVYIHYSTSVLEQYSLNVQKFDAYRHNLTHTSTVAGEYTTTVVSRETVQPYRNNAYKITRGNEQSKSVVLAFVDYHKNLGNSPRNSVRVVPFYEENTGKVSYFVYGGGGY